jgi:hypothetical protein
MSRIFFPLPPWTAQCRFHQCHVRITVSQPDGQQLLQARLPLPPAHPRALLELLESLARHCGHPVDAVMSAGAKSLIYFDEIIYGDGLQLGPSALVHVVFTAPPSRQLRLAPDAWRSR